MGDPTRLEIQLDRSYHYPPELLELLCDAIPALFRSKRGVVDFFVGCGITYAYVRDWMDKVKQDRGSVRKHEIVRSVLCRLNDAGDAALKYRREVIKRISEFDDFSACWENDRYKAQGLVAQIRQVVNIKDAFTRMNLERERERKAHQAQYTAALTARQNKAAERAALKGRILQAVRRNEPPKTRKGA